MDELTKTIDEEMCEGFEKERHEIRMEAKEAIKKAQSEYKKHYDKKRKPVSLQLP